MAVDSREPESRRQSSDRQGNEPSRRSRSRSRSRSRRRSRSHSRRGDRSRSRPSRKSQDDNLPDTSRRQRGSKWDVSGGAADKHSLSEAIVPITPLSTTLLSPFFETAPAHLGQPKQTVQVDQRFATYVIGRSCEWVRPIEAATGAVIKLDCSAGSEGPSICRVYGDEDVTSIAADMIRIRLGTADGSLPEVTLTEKVEVEHAHVFRILGKDGEAVKQLGIDTGAGVTFQRGPITSESCDFLFISGQKDRVDVARRLVQQRLDECTTVSFGPAASNPPETCVIPVEQQFIGWIMGKNKDQIRQIADESGAFIQVKQAGKRDGRSIIKIAGNNAAVSAARVRIQQRIEHGRKYQDDKKKQFMLGDWLCPQCGDQQFRKNDTCRRCNVQRPDSLTRAEAREAEGGDKGKGKYDTGAFLKRDSDTAFKVDQQYVGFIIGPGGSTFRDIKEVTGAKIFVDQETRDQGFSVVRIGDAGTPENLMAQDIIEQKIEEGLERSQRAPLADSNRNGVPATSVPHVTIVPPPQQPLPRPAGGLPQIVLPAGWKPPAAPTAAVNAGSGKGQWNSSEWGGTNFSIHSAKESMMDMYWGGASAVVDPSANAERSMAAGAAVSKAPPPTAMEPALTALEEDDAIEILGPVIVEAVGLGTREEQRGHFFKHLDPLRPRLTTELYDKIVASFEEALEE